MRDAHDHGASAPPDDPRGANQPSPLVRPKRPTSVNPDPPKPVRGKPQGIPPFLKPININTRNIEQALRGYLNQAEPRVARFLYSTWNAEREAIKFQEIRNAVRDAEVPREWIAQWQQDYAAFVNESLDPELRKASASGASEIAESLAKRLGISVAFPEAAARLERWIELNGADLAVNLSAEQTTAVRNIIRHYVVDLGAGPAELDRVIRPVIGLTPREATAVQRFRDTLSVEGLAPRAIDHRVGNYSGFLKRRRGIRIARTELAFAYNFGGHEQITAAVSEGALPRSVAKEYLTAQDELVCPFCRPLNGTEVMLSDTFPGLTRRVPNTLVPPVHPNCRCTIIYKVYQPGT